MKTITILIAASLVLISCSKQMETPAPAPTAIERILINPSVTIDSVRPSAAYAGSNMSLKFSVYLSNVVSSEVKDVQLFRVNIGSVYKITNASNGLNILFDRLMHDYPTAAQNVFYYFAITLNSGEVLKSSEFQVY